MAISQANLNDMQINVNTTVLPGLADQIFDSNTTYKRMKKGKVQTGTQCDFRVQYAKNASASTWDLQRGLVPTAPNEFQKRMSLDWGGFQAPVSIDFKEQTCINGKEALADLMEDKILNAKETIADLIGTGLFSLGTDVNGIIGMRQAICNNANAATEGVSATYAGFSRATYSWWDANMLGTNSATYNLANLSSTGATVAYTLLYLLRSLWGSCTQGSDRGRTPSVHITSQSLYDCYQEWLVSKGQVMLNRTTDKNRADFGFQELSYQGKPILVDSHCPTNKWYMINEDRLFWVPFGTKEMKMTQWKEAQNQIETKVAQFYIAGQLVLTEPRSCGVITTYATDFSF